jgi:hypothetical protein
MTPDSDAPRKVVPITLTYPTFTDDGYEEVEETRHLYYSMGAVTKMLDKLGVSNQEAKARAVQADDSDEAEEELGNLLTDAEIEVSQQRGMLIIVWAGLRSEARSLGERLTVDDVGEMIDPDSIDPVMDAVNEAFSYFQTGEEETRQADVVTEDGEADDGDAAAKKAMGATSTT